MARRPHRFDGDSLTPPPQVSESTRGATPVTNLNESSVYINALYSQGERGFLCCQGWPQAPRSWNVSDRASRAALTGTT